MSLAKPFGFFRSLLVILLPLLFAVGGNCLPEPPDTLLHRVAAPPSAGFQENAHLGRSVASSGGFVAVGAPGDEGLNGPNRGFVKVFSSETGELLHVIPNPSQFVKGGFGLSLAMSGSRLVVGAPSERLEGGGHYDIGVGIAYVFELASPHPTAPSVILKNPTGKSYSSFGKEVAMDGDTVVVGMPGGDYSVYVYDLSTVEAGQSPPTQANPAKLYPEYTGRSLAVSGSRLALYGRGTAGAAVGVTIYDLEAGGTDPVLTIQSPVASTSVVFGETICLEGSRLVVGNYFDGVADRLAVYDLDGEAPAVPVRTLPSFRNSTLGLGGSLLAVGTTTDQTTTFPAPGGGVLVYDLSDDLSDAPARSWANPVSSERGLFGEAVSLDGGKIIVGAPGDDTSAVDAGAAFVFSLDTDEILRLEEPGAKTYAGFGSATAISGGVLVVGAPRDDTGATNSGCAYVYDVSDPDSLNPLTVLRNPEPYPYERFGYSVAVSGRLVAIGTYGSSHVSLGPSKVHVFDLEGADPAVPIHTLTNPAASGGDRFGSALAMDGGLLVVGARDGDSPYIENTGIIYVFDLLSPSPASVAFTLTHPIPVRRGNLGTCVAISGRRVVAGVPYFQNSPDIFAGAVVVYDLDQPQTPGTVIENPTRAKGERFGAAVGISGTKIIVGDPGDTSFQSANGNAFVYDIASATPNVPTHRLAQQAYVAFLETFGSAVGISGDFAYVASREKSYVFELNPGDAEPRNAVYEHSSITRDGITEPSLASDGSVFVVGAPFARNDSIDRGSVFVYAPSPPARVQFDKAMLDAGLDADKAEPGSVPFGDGTRNLLKYAFDMDLSAADFRISGDNFQPEGLPLVNYSQGGYFYIKFLRKKRSRLVYTPQISSTLEDGGWRNFENAPHVEPYGDDWELVFYEEFLDSPSHPRVFGRVKVELPD